MNLKTTYVLFGVLLAVIVAFGAYVYWGGPSKNPEAGDYLFADFNRPKDPVKTDDIDTVRIERGGGKEALVFRREKDGWRMTEPHALRTDPYLVDALVREVTGARREKTEMSSKLADYGLDDPKEVVTLKKGDEEWKLNVGNVSKSENGVVYVSNAADPKNPAAVRKSTLSTALDKKLNDFRSKELLALSAANAASVQGVQLRAGDKELALEKTGDGLWRFVKPPYGPAEFEGQAAGPTPPPADKKATGVRDLLTDAGAIRVETDGDFVKEGASDADLASKYGLEKGKPETLRVEVKAAEKDADAKTQVLLVGKKAPKPEEKKEGPKGDTKKKDDKKDETPDYYYARLEGEAAVVRVPAPKVQPLLDAVANPEPLRSRELVTAAGAAKIDALDLKAGSTTVKLRQGADGRWKMYDHGARATDDAAVHDLTDALTRKDLFKKFVDKEDGLEFDKPAAVVSAWLDGIKKAEPKKDGDKDDKKKDENKEPELKSATPAVKLTFGKHDRANKLVYVLRESGEGGAKDRTVLAVSDSLLDKVTAGPLAYLDRKLPTFETGFDAAKDVTKLTLQRAGATWELTKEKKDDRTTWKIVKPQRLAGKKANDSAIGGVLHDLAALRATEVVAEKPSESDLDSLYGLKSPPTQATVTVTRDGKDEDWVYSFGKENDAHTGVFARQNKGDIVFVVPKLAVDRINTADLRDPTVFDFEVAKVKSAKITVYSNDLGGPVALELKREAANKWEKTGGPIDPNGAKVEGFVGGLSRLTASKFVTPKAGADTGLDVKKGALKVEITVEGEDKPLELTVGKEDPDNKGLLFAKSSTLGDDVFLVPEVQFKEAKASPAYFRK